MNMKLTLRIFFALGLITLAACASPAATTAIPAPPTPTQAPMTGGQQASIDQIMNVNWQWTQLQETNPPSQSVVPPGQAYNLTLTPDGNFTFTADCNSGSGTYTSQGTDLTLTLGPVTLAECSPESLSSNFISLLGQVTSFGSESNQLRLVVDKGTTIMGFASPQPTPEVQLAGPAVAPESGGVTLETAGVFPAYQTSLVQATAYDPARAGMPQHAEVTFGQPGAPIIYIIPTEDYKKLWDVNDNPLVSNSLAKLEDLLSQKPSPFNTCCMSALPVEMAGGLNDIVAQGRYLPIQSGEGLRFVGRFMQDANPAANGQFYYVFQGFSTDHKYFISMFYPVTSTKLPNIDQVPQSEIDLMTQDPQAYAAQKAKELDAFSPEDFSPSLTALDALITSLKFTPQQ
jgi:heat shock protein HslJ